MLAPKIFLEKPIYKLALEKIQQIFIKHEVDSTHGLAHAIKIASYTERALQDEQNLNEKIEQEVVLSALLHDVDDRKYFPANTNDLTNAKTVLEELDVESERKLKILQMIDLVSFSKNGNTIDQSVPSYYYLTRYVDRTEAIGILGLYRAYLYSLKINQRIYTKETSRPLTQQELLGVIKGRDIQYVNSNGKSQSHIDHLFDKMLHIRLPTQIKNSFLKQIYEQRQKQMMQFVLKHARNGYSQYEEDLKEQFRINQVIWEEMPDQRKLI